MYTTGAHLTPMKVTNSDGKELFVWAVTLFEDSGFLDGEDYDPIESAEDLETLISHKEYSEPQDGDTKFVMFREFIYGLDVSEFCEGWVVLYDTKEEAEESLKEYIDDTNDAYQNGDLEEPYQNDMEIREVILYLSDDCIEDVETKRRFNLEQQ